MKKLVMTALFIAAGTMLMAGGTIIPMDYADNAKKPCHAGDIYVDYEKKLMWQDESYGDIEDGAYSHNRSAGKAGRWAYANNYCSGLVYAGYDDWRLPMVGELTNLYYQTRGLKNIIGVDFWTSTPSDGINYWSVYGTYTGQPYEHKKSDTQYIRCVRCLDEKR